jgi:hypothetical protein
MSDMAMLQQLRKPARSQKIATARVGWKYCHQVHIGG